MELYELSASGMARGVRAGEFSAAEVLESCLGRIEKGEGVLSAMVTLTPEKARKEAALVDRMVARGEDPSAGVPLILKDNICMRALQPLRKQNAGELFTYGSASWNGGREQDPLPGRLAGRVRHGQLRVLPSSAPSTLGYGKSSGAPAGAPPGGRGMRPLAWGPIPAGLASGHCRCRSGLKPVRLVSRRGVVPLAPPWIR